MPVPCRGNYIGGRFTRPARGTELVSENPGDLLNPVGRAIVSPEAAPAAVEAAAKAFPAWSRTPLPARVRRVRKFQRVLRRRQAEGVRLLALEVGKPLHEARREISRLIEKVDGTVDGGLKLIRPFWVKAGPKVRGECRYRPLGVLAVIGPFNFPAHTPGGHFIPAILTGNTVVFKPSEYAPFVGQWLAECWHAAGLPAGVFNLVQGDAAVGKRLVEHSGISAVLFTGSTAAGQAIRAATIKNPAVDLVLEMGGKNAAIVLQDADLELAVREVLMSAYSMGGQRCNATSRALVDRKVLKGFLDRLLLLVDRIRVGYPLEEGVLMGPLVSHDAVVKFRRYMKLAEEEGFETLLAAKAPGTSGSRRGYYVTPGLHLCERPARNKSQRYRREEIFGPDLAVYAVRDEAEAVRLNNEVDYGLVTSVFTRSKRRFERVAAQVDTGLVNWNRGTIYASGKLPFGGTKASGSFRPAGLFSPYYCTAPVAVLQDSRPFQKRSYVI